MTVPRRTELEAALRATKKDSAPGPDGVRYPQVKQLNEKEKQELADIINTSKESGKISEDQRIVGKPSFLNPSKTIAA